MDERATAEVLGIREWQLVLENGAKVSWASNWFDVSCKTTEDGSQATDLVWTKKELGRQRPVFAGCYVIETNEAGMEAVDIWNHPTLISIRHSG